METITDHMFTDDSLTHACIICGEPESVHDMDEDDYMAQFEPVDPFMYNGSTEFEAARYELGE